LERLNVEPRKCREAYFAKRRDLLILGITKKLYC
jgi:hypothetical protein